MGCFVSRYVPLEFRYPIIYVSFGDRSIGTFGMLVPEAAIDEYSSPMTRHHYVRLPRHLLHVQSIPIPRAVHHGTHSHLRDGVLAADPAHDPTPVSSNAFRRRPLTHFHLAHFARLGLSQLALLHFGHTRGLSAVSILGTHSCPHRHL